MGPSRFPDTFSISLLWSHGRRNSEPGRGPTRNPEAPVKKHRKRGKGRQ
ncbi:hypothetical protein SSCG_04588 [Streptomyces clavuligerus]|nr:hypothetical protein SSCG_04588 [Streptomyces clavuligerus]